MVTKDAHRSQIVKQTVAYVVSSLVCSLLSSGIYACSLWYKAVDSLSSTIVAVFASHRKGDGVLSRKSVFRYRSQDYVNY